MIRKATLFISGILACLAPTISYAQPSCPSASSGLVTIALASPRFPVGKAADALRTSPHPSFAFLLRSFGTKYSNVQALIDRLSSEAHSDRCITVIIYGDCGPCRFPRRPKGLFNILAPRESISSLNRKLEHGDLRTLQAFNKEWQSILPSLPQRQGLRYVFMPGLEDNFTQRAYAVLEALAQQIFAGRADVQIGRNALSSFRGGGIREAHSYAPSTLRQLKRGDVITGDGEVLCFPGQRCRGYSLSAVRRLALEARARGIHFLVWLPESQGLPRNIGNNPVFIPPSRRTYTIPGVGHIRQLLKG
jgi:hypothetical protein